MGFWVGTYGLNVCHDFFSIGAWEQKLCPNKVKTKKRGQQKKFKIGIGIFWNFFSS